jgi:signal transduction histidine kinase/response regulator RpfG family c-di-GMP phosphodiesterase
MSQEDADAALSKLNRHIEKNSEILQLEKENDFDFIARKSGRYFIVTVEPFEDRAVLKTVLKYVRKLHRDAFVNKIKPGDIKKKVKKSKKPPLKIKEVMAETEALKDKSVEKVKESTPKSEKIVKEIKKEPKPVEKPKPKPTQKIFSDDNSTPKVSHKVDKTDTKGPKKPDTDTQKTEKSPAALFYILAGTILFLLVAMSLLYLARRENRLLVKRLKDSSDKLDACKSNMMQKEVFLAKISHELRTPMNAIIGLSHIVLQTDLSHLQRENVSKIKYSGELLLDIINDILDISKMEAGELKIEKVELNINDVLDHVSNMVALNAKSKGLELIFDVDKSVPSHFIGDPLRLGQVLINLLSNSIKFTKKGEINLEIYTVSKDDDKILLEFKITDTGIGMTSKQISKLFKSFSQADDSTSRVYGGTGLGLSISKQLVEMMGGGIRVESQYGHGSSFIFNIELVVEDPQNKRHYRLPSKSFMSKRALIVDTNTKSIAALSKMLEYFHYDVQTMPIMQEAEKLLWESHFDVIFIDEQKFSDYAMSAIEKIKAKKMLKVVLIESLYNRGENSSLHNNKVIDRYLLKPFNQQSVFNVILELYGEKQAKKSSNNRNYKDELLKLKNKHILLAEDNEINQRVLVGLLDGTGIKVSIAENGKEAIQKLHENPKFDLILMDISMPVMDGYEASQIIRDYDEYDSIPILALTANSMEDEIEHAISCGMQGFIGKPLSVDVLYEKLLEFLGKKDSKEKVFRAKEKRAKVQQDDKEKKNINTDILDVIDGTKRCGNDEDLYKAILNDFNEMYADSVEVFKSISSEKRYSDGKKFAHDVKGVSANIGAKELSKAAQALEKAFVNESKSNYPILIKNYQESLNRLLDEIKNLK